MVPRQRSSAPVIGALELSFLDAQSLSSVGNLLRALCPDLKDLDLRLKYYINAASISHLNHVLAAYPHLAWLRRLRFTVAGTATEGDAIEDVIRSRLQLWDNKGIVEVEELRTERVLTHVDVPISTSVAHNSDRPSSSAW
ncbi:hypothetical protein DFH08DRAFT_1073146 [Mycena albidolilacea]|uniref:Uncharacterized protein n=1 Tax=Mycena albidolilacea TaxID=1033008 RepID=A0AAD7F280_9AGAR|nr:hypothetical protein DFH08DRAFT_1073146 [Mycena albidolilacea]